MGNTTSDMKAKKPKVQPNRPLALVTGAAGFVGRHLAAHLLDHGRRVRALLRRTSDASVLPSSVELVYGDLTKPETLDGVGQGVDEVYHIACATAGTFDAGRGDENLFFSVNRDGTMNLVEALYRDPKEPGPAAFIYSSSTAAIGSVPEIVVDETTPCRPSSPYQRSKRAAELKLLDRFRRKPFPVRIVRSCLVAGPGKDKSELLSMFKLVKRGLFPVVRGMEGLRKPMISIHDLVEALRLAAEQGRDGEIYLVTSGRPYTVAEMAEVTGRIVGATRTHLTLPYLLLKAGAIASEAAARVLPIKPPITKARIELFTADRDIRIDKARRELGYEPKHTDLFEMLEEAYQYHHSKGDI